MTDNERKATASAKTMAPSNKSTQSQYQTPLSKSRAQKIATRRAQIPKVYQATYDTAVSGKSLRAAVNSNCLECMGWQREEVRRCTSFECSFWSYRPYQKNFKKAPQRPDYVPETTNSGEGDT